jgi:hypothetical protein
LAKAVAFSATLADDQDYWDFAGKTQAKRLRARLAASRATRFDGKGAFRRFLLAKRIGRSGCRPDRPII